MGIYDDPISQEILADAPITCPSCDEFISQFTHPEQDCGLTNNDQGGTV